MKNNYIFNAPHLRNSIAYDHDFLFTCVNNDISRCFFSFFFIFIFWAIRGVGVSWGGGKRAKIVQNEKEQLHPSHAIS